MPGAIAQGLIWGIMAIGVFITYKVLDYADLTVDGTMATGGAVCIMLMMNGVNVLHRAAVRHHGRYARRTHHRPVPHRRWASPPYSPAYSPSFLCIPSIWSSWAARPIRRVSVTKYQLLVSSRYVKEISLPEPDPHHAARHGGAHRRTILVLRHGNRLLAALHRRERGHVPRAGHQHQPRQDPGAYDLQRHRGAGLGDVFSLSGLRGREHGPRRCGHRSGRRHHQRRDLRPAVYELRAQDGRRRRSAR